MIRSVILAVTSCLAASAAFAVCDTTKIVEVEIKNMQFNPAHIEICAGQTVRWTNNEAVGPEPINHTVTADPARAQMASHVQLPEGAETFHSKSIKQGMSWQYTFNVLGDYKYICVPHEMMGHLGSLTVVDDLP